MSPAVLAPGATLLTRQPVTEDGWRWHILADPDANELYPPGPQPPASPSPPIPS
jgi:hypothetical protein